MLYKETVSGQMWELLQKLMKDEKLKEYVLVGGTVLSLRIGHRLSVDIDLFITEDFNPQMMLRYLHDTYGADEKESRTYNNTVLTYIDDIKVDIVTHKYPLLNPVENTEGIRMISNEDIGAMKLHAIFQNGQRLKDFVDMYFLLEHNPLKFYLQAYERKYEGDAFWAKHALSYFGNINQEYDVSMVKGKEKNWIKMSERLKKAVADPELKFAIQNQDNKIENPKKGRDFRR
ncbi:nucleotidyl transferase AbiEii/AbiGii toxin family protein [Flavobacterium sp. UGB4466]|uniref:nucleotidyl transferase AbiEii/AbiGii toxin family protein n=1 Tax=Flavobacterium sp. UGB4466 TaxID=2730889 RepID=UPI00192B88DF|nr:nucleotidyl transferase AbiEii/AbiGii toxin family protein [Flavobacterium sp. UGB4466]